MEVEEYEFSDINEENIFHAIDQRNTSKDTYTLVDYIFTENECEYYDSENERGSEGQESDEEHFDIEDYLPLA